MGEEKINLSRTKKLRRLDLLFLVRNYVNLQVLG